MSGKYKYPYVAWDENTGTARFLGVFNSLNEAKKCPIEMGETVVNKVPVNRADEWVEQMIESIHSEAEDIDHDFGLIEKEWLPDKPNTSQTSLTKRALGIDRDKVYGIVVEINGIPDISIQVSRWAMLYDKLNKVFPKENKPIAGWVER